VTGVAVLLSEQHIIILVHLQRIRDPGWCDLARVAGARDIEEIIGEEDHQRCEYSMQSASDHSLQHPASGLRQEHRQPSSHEEHVEDLQQWVRLVHDIVTSTLDTSDAALTKQCHSNGVKTAGQRHQQEIVHAAHKTITVELRGTKDHHIDEHQAPHKRKTSEDQQKPHSHKNGKKEQTQKKLLLLLLLLLFLLLLSSNSWSERLLF